MQCSTKEQWQTFYEKCLEVEVSIDRAVGIVGSADHANPELDWQRLTWFQHNADALRSEKLLKVYWMVITDCTNWMEQSETELELRYTHPMYRFALVWHRLRALRLEKCFEWHRAQGLRESRHFLNTMKSVFIFPADRPKFTLQIEQVLQEATGFNLCGYQLRGEETCIVLVDRKTSQTRSIPSFRHLCPRHRRSACHLISTIFPFFELVGLRDVVLPIVEYAT